MNQRILFTLALLLSVHLLTAQTNVFTLAGNGDFENPGNEDDFEDQLTTQSYFLGWQATRVNEISGGWALKCVNTDNGSVYKVLPSKKFLTAQTGKGYLVRAKVYVPSSSGILSGKNIAVGLRRDYAQSTGDVSNCNVSGKSKYFVTGTDPYDQWVDIHQYVTLNFTTPDLLYGYIYLGNHTGTFYIDKFQIFEITLPINPISTGAVIDNVARNITLNPIGGVPGYDYTYSWSDGFTGKDRVGLPYGTYTVTVAQTVSTMICPENQKVESYRFVEPPVIPNPTHTVCVNASGPTLQVSPVGEGTITWYDAAQNGTLLFTGPNYQVPARSIGGVYKYFAQRTVTGYAPSVRTEAVVTVVSSSPINPNASIDYTARNITLNPTGGVGGLSYTYSWSDGFTGKDRVGLAYGSYTVTVSQTQGSPAVCTITPKSETYKFLEPPVILTPLSTICTNTSMQLQVQTGGEGSIAWFDALQDGTFLGSGYTFNVTPKTVPGQYRYYAERSVSGYPSSKRTEALVNVMQPGAVITLVSNVVFITRPLEFLVGNHQSSYSYRYLITLPGGGTTTVNATEPSLLWQPSLGGEHQIDARVTDSFGCYVSFNFTVNVLNVIPLCSTLIPKNSGELKLDKFSGLVVFNPTDQCSENVSIGCIGGKVESPLLNNVVSASATAFSDQWSTAYLPVALPAGLNSIEKSERGKWRPSSTHTFNKAVNYQASDKNYQAGRFQLAHFNWQYPDVNKKSGWLEVNKVDKYSPHGDPVEEHNALNVSSTARFGYGGSVPYLIAQNAHYTSVYFEGFEKLYGSSFEENVPESGGNQNSGYFHSGKYSFQLTGQFKSRAFTPNDQLRQKGMQVRFWARGDSPATNITVLSGAGTAGTIKLIAQSGEWFLLESMIAGVPAGTSQFTVEIKKSGGSNLWIDDVRMQPADAEMTCYVYDPRTLRLLTVFDDQHFGMHYQYNAEGKLIRKMVETEKGIKTIQETQYNVPLIDKASSLGN